MWPRMCIHACENCPIDLPRSMHMHMHLSRPLPRPMRAHASAGKDIQVPSNRSWGDVSKALVEKTGCAWVQENTLCCTCLAVVGLISYLDASGQVCLKAYGACISGRDCTACTTRFATLALGNAKRRTRGSIAFDARVFGDV